ncbi:MAG: hypothetical protein DMF53_08650, partial [Acidobacteria bacterium]
KRLPIVLAPPLGGYLIQRYGMAGGMRTGFFFSILLSVLMLLGLWRAFRAHRPAEHSAPAGGGKVRLQPALVRLLTADCLIRLCEGLPEVFLVVWALEIARISPGKFGLLTSILMVTAILSYLPAAMLAERAEKKPFVVLTYLFFTLFPLAVVVSHSFLALAGAYVIGGLREIGEPFAVAGAAAIGGALWTVRPELTFYVAAALGAAGTLWAAIGLPSRPAVPREETR